MSLINEALKKAQRARVEDPAAAETLAPGGAVPKRREARSANTMVLIGAGAVTLIVLSVVATVYFLSGESKPAPAAAPVAKSTATPTPAAPAAIPPPVTPTAPTPPSAAAATAAAPTVTVAPPAPATAPAPATPPPRDAVAPTAAETQPVGKPIVAAPATPPPAPPPATASTPPAAPARPVTLPPASTPVAATPPATTPAGAAAPAAAPKLDPRIAAYVDGIRITGVRASGNDSRVLMNDRVYRVNDVVERNLGVRLIKVANDSLTFADANGVTYVKHL